MLTFPRSYQAQVEGALWAWETFGGIGARTRRGFGALKGVRLDSSTVSLPHPGNVQQWITENLRAHVAVGTCPDGVPHIEQGWQGKITAGQRSPVEAWKFLIRKLKEFRQQRPGPPNDPGRSVWPEPDAVRRITRQHLNKVVNGQARRHEPVHSAGNIFPRAAFGMPIIFHFKDMNRSNPSDPNSDPKDTTLQGVNCHRFASPLILRPLACSEGRAVGLAVILQGSDLPPLILKGAPENPPVRATLTSTEASAISPLDGNPDVLQKFLQTF